MKTKVTPGLLDTVMQTRQALPWTNVPLPDIVYLLEATQYLGRVRNVM